MSGQKIIRGLEEALEHARQSEAETPFPTSPLNEGAVEEVIAKLRRIADEGAADEAASLLTTLLTNLAKAQRERATYEDRWQSEFKSRLTAEARAEAAESRLSHLQTRLEEAEGALEPYARLHPASFGAIVAAMSSRFETLKGTRSGAAAYYDLEAIKKMADGHQRARAALQPKGESRE